MRQPIVLRSGISQRILSFTASSDGSLPKRTLLDDAKEVHTGRMGDCLIPS
jgi:hypothetical protein